MLRIKKEHNNGSGLVSLPFFYGKIAKFGEIERVMRNSGKSRNYAEFGEIEKFREFGNISELREFG